MGFSAAVTTFMDIRLSTPSHVRRLKAPPCSKDSDAVAIARENTATVGVGCPIYFLNNSSTLVRCFCLIIVECDMIQGSQVDGDSVLNHLEGICPTISFSMRKKYEIGMNPVLHLCFYQKR